MIPINLLSFLLFSPQGAQHVDNYEALWFKKIDDPVSGESLHVYKGGYWDAKEEGSWDICADIF